MWVAVFTGGTAILASWVTTHGNARTTKIQADASARAQSRNHVRDMRRTAYLDLIEQAHLTGQLYWRVGDAYVQLSEHEARQSRIQELRTELRTAFDPLMRCTRIVVLEGPRSVADAAENLTDAARIANRALWTISLGELEARKDFDAAEEAFRVRLERFTLAAQTAMTETY